ncbi:MAG: polysaccharide deacetylase family protein [Flavisolibacter sp.]|jgi:peptidoglycan/xylan/chitin deacetylase (PgdA/CDA1 family)|nr:polysaccharide deacetylase family protein [Flavisolibacter sp.]
MKNPFRFFLMALAAQALFSCSSSTTQSSQKDSISVNTTAGRDTSQVNKEKQPASAQEILSRKQVPILCYHRIREIQMPSKSSMGYEVTLAQFKAQMKVLADSGYHSITPNQYYDYLVYGSALPEKPVMITYDDTREEHYTIAKPEMEKYGFKGVFYIMTISINRPNYMSKEQIKQLSDDGHIVASHSWDHKRVDRLQGNDWMEQFDKPKKQLEEITGKPIEYFAYPFGIWSQDAIPEIKKRGYKMSYILSTKRDSLEPLHTARRMIVSPEWTPQGMVRVMKSTFR